MSEVRIFTDGGCRGNPGIGAWGALMCWGEHVRTLGGGSADTTNNRMELLGAINALKMLKSTVSVVITTDSKYVMQGITQWIEGWKRKGWLTSNRKPVKNKDLWQELDALVSNHTVRWEWVKGHAGHPENEACDLCANEIMDRIQAGEVPQEIMVDEREELGLI